MLNVTAGTVKLVLYALATISVIAWLCCGCTVPKPRQTSVDVQLLAAIDTTTEDIGAEINRAAELLESLARSENKTYSIVLPQGVYDFSTPIVLRSHVSLVAYPAVPRSVRLRWTGGLSAEPLITLKGGYGKTLQGFEIRSKSSVSKLVAIKVDNVLNGIISDVRVTLSNSPGSIALDIAGRESLTVQRAELRAGVPIRFERGDNIAFRDLDLGADADSLDIPSCCVWMTGNPHQVVFEGSFTAQGGDCCFNIDTDVGRTGQCLIIRNLRYEQSTGRLPAINMLFRNRAIESVVLDGCRWGTVHSSGVSIEYNPAYPLIPKLTIVGGFMPGDSTVWPSSSSR